MRTHRAPPGNGIRMCIFTLSMLGGVYANAEEKAAADQQAGEATGQDRVLLQEPAHAAGAGQNAGTHIPEAEPLNRAPHGPPTLIDEEDDPASSEIGFIEQQIYRGEANDAQQRLETVISEIEEGQHRYHEDLLAPITLLGDALMVQKDYPGALDQYDRARHIARVSYGLFDPRQLAVVYREADAYRKIGDLRAAGQREEYAYEVMHKTYDNYDPQLLPGLIRLGNFYIQTYNYLAARSLYNRALLVHEKNGTDFNVEAIISLKGIAKSHRLERFPPFYVASADDNRLQGPAPGLTTTDLDSQHITFNNFPAGEKALQQIVEIRRQQQPREPLAVLDAIIELADWHLMFERTNTANTLYSHVYTKMAEQGKDAAAFFAKPALVYLPQPHDPKPPPASQRDQRTTGVVTLQFDVATSGRIRKLKTLESEPPKLMDFRVRRSMRLAVFRPKLVDGVPVVAETQTYSHEFDYFPPHGPAGMTTSRSEISATSQPAESQ